MHWILLPLILFSFNAYSGENEINHSAQSKKHTSYENHGTDSDPIAVRIIPAPDAKTKADTEEKRSKEKAEEDRLLTRATIVLAAVTALLAIFTGGLWISTHRLAKDAKDTSDRQADELRKIERAFVFLDGFDVDLTTAADAKIIPIEFLPEEYKDKPWYYITRVVVRPRWKNNGNTPTIKMTVNVKCRGPEGTIPPDYAFQDGTATQLFLAPQAIEPSDSINIPQAQAYIDWGLNLGIEEPLIFIWGRAEYRDIFGCDHFVQWCYRIIFDDPKGEKRIRTRFIQWGDYNRSDVD